MVWELYEFRITIQDLALQTANTYDEIFTLWFALKSLILVWKITGRGSFAEAGACRKAAGLFAGGVLHRHRMMRFWVFLL